MQESDGDRAIDKLGRRDPTYRLPTTSGRDRVRAELEQQIQAYLAKGGTIEKIPGIEQRTQEDLARVATLIQLNLNGTQYSNQKRRKSKKRAK